MNKKIAFFLSVAIALLSIVLVSTFGLLPEDLRPHIPMTNLSFDIPLTKNSDGTYTKYIVMNFKANNNTIDLSEKIKYLPFDATNLTLQYFTDQSTDKVAVSATGILTIYELSLNSFVVSVKSTDGSNLTDNIVIKKPSSNETTFDDDWEWG